MHWVYILQCGEKNNKIYIGETKRLYTRIKEHCKKNTGSVTTHFFYPNQIIGLYKLENATKTSELEAELISKNVGSIISEIVSAMKIFFESPIAKSDIPVIFYFNGTHADYHAPTDTVEKIEYALLEKRTRLIFYTAWEIANREDRLRLKE